jgi:Reverse transcriptase (RNA-dependent DNA polymerase)
MTKQTIKSNQQRNGNNTNNQQPSNAPIQTYVLYAIPDGAPQMDEALQALYTMQLRKSPGAPGISVEQLRNWHCNARVADDTCNNAIKIWNKSLHLITIAFTTGQVPTTFYTGIMVLIQKPKQQGYCGITLLETFYKLLFMIIHIWLNLTIQLHDSIHGLRTQWGTRTAIMHVKLMMKQVQQDSNPMYMVFLDLKKAYNTINCNQMLELLQQYGVRPNMLHIIKNIWAHDTIILKQHQFFGKAFKAEGGVCQGDIFLQHYSI